MIISNRFVNRKGDVMIYTVTFNPSLDYIVEVDDFKMGEPHMSICFPERKGLMFQLFLIIWE